MKRVSILLVTALFALSTGAFAQSSWQTTGNTDNNGVLGTKSGSNYPIKLVTNGIPRMYIANGGSNEHSGYIGSTALPDSLWNDYYPYAQGQTINYESDKGGQMSLHVDSIVKCADEYDITFNCDAPVECTAFKCVYLHSDEGWQVRLSNTNYRLATINFCVVDLWASASYCESFTSGMGDTIPYWSSNNQHVDNICHVKHKGLVSFYDVERQCTWHLAE